MVFYYNRVHLRSAPFSAGKNQGAAVVPLQKYTLTNNQTLLQKKKSLSNFDGKTMAGRTHVLNDKPGIAQPIRPGETYITCINLQIMIWDQQNVYCACRAPKSVPSRCSAWIFAVAPEPEGKKNVCGLFVCPNSRYIWMDKFCCKWCYRFHTHTHKQQRCRNSSMVSLERQAGPNVSSTLCNKPESPILAVAALYDRGHIYTSQPPQ